jgi:hypothetical protein
MIIFCLFFVVIYKIGLQHAEIVMVLSTYVTHYGPWTGCSYYNLTTTDPQGSPSPLPGDASICYVGLRPGNLHITQSNKTKAKKITKIKIKRGLHHKTCGEIFVFPTFRLTMDTINVNWFVNTRTSHATFVLNQVIIGIFKVLY